MNIKHRLKLNPNINYTALLYSCLYGGSFTLSKYYSDPRFAPDPVEHPFRHYLHKCRGNYVQMTYQRYGRDYFTEAEYMAIEHDDKLDEWIEWVQQAKGDYLEYSYNTIGHCNLCFTDQHHLNDT